MSTKLTEDMPEEMKERQKLSHAIAKISFNKVWNISVAELAKLNRGITGNDALSYFGTLLCNFSARWLIEMIKIAESDEAGITREDLIKDTLNGVIEMMGAKATFEDDEPLPNGIKKT